MRSVLIRPVIAFVAAAAPAAGQDSTAVTPRANPASAPFMGWHGGFAIGLPGSGPHTEPELFTLGVSLSHLRPRALGADLWLGTMPRVLAYGGAFAGARADAVLPIPIAGDLLLLPAVGVSAIGALAGGGGGGVLGVNAGVSAIAGSAPLGLRAGVTYHRFNQIDQGFWLLEIGFIGGGQKHAHRRSQ